MSVIIIPIVIVGGGLVILTVFLAKSFLRPRKLDAIADYIKQGKPVMAANGAKFLLSKDHRNVDAHYLLGKAYVAEGKSELAFMEFKTINQIGKFGNYCKEIPYRKEVAQLYERYDQLDEALKEYLLLIKLEPNLPENFLKTGILFEQRGDAKKSYNYYKKTVQLDKSNAEAHSRLGMLLYRAKKPTEAKAELSTAIKLDPANYMAYFYIAKIFKDNGDHMNALSYFEKAQKEPEYKVKALVERGGCYISLNNYDQAIGELSRAVRLATDETSAEALYGRYFLAACYEKIRNLDKAVELWEQIYAKKPSFQDVADKLSHYQELRTDDRVKDYLTSNQEEFFNICKSIVKVMNLDPRDISEMTGGCQIVAAESESKWRNARKMPRLMWFYRVPEPIDESSIRKLLEEMKKMNIPRGIMVTSSNFTRRAFSFAESRPIDLIKKEKLQSFLKKVE